MDGLYHEVFSYTPDASEILKLHAKTGAPMLECRKVLIEARGNEDRAISILARMSANGYQPESLIENYR